MQHRGKFFGIDPAGHPNFGATGINLDLRPVPAWVPAAVECQSAREPRWQTRHLTDIGAIRARTLHDPVRLKYNVIGKWYLNDAAPPRQELV